ncbi:ATP-binding protein [Methanobrevibacter sp.]|uniref:ATP-binding protein n=1 Tax=Methanobrevibacter sp. TaxID=66852 RepID=UPI0025FF32B1|nr:ATP-binding protein [Methanobrevibacter sp.]MBQ2831678.1 ATP-binding protein [Methanobrevibacter sp.]
MNSITLKPELKELYTINEFISNKLSQENLQVNLIVEEVFVNIVHYSKTDFITVNVEYDHPILTLEFIDNGVEFNPLLKEDREAPQTIEDAPIGGLGIFLTKELSDDLDYANINGENHLKITKKVE